MVTTRCQFPTTVLTTTTGVSSSTWRSGPLAFTNADHAAGCGAGGSILDKTVDAWGLGQRRNVTTTTGRTTLPGTPTTFVPRVNVTEAASDTDTGVFVVPGDKLEIVDLGTGVWSGGNAQIWAGYWFRDPTNGNGLIDSCSREIANPYRSVSFFNNPSNVLDVRGEPFQPLFYDNSACNAGADYPIARGAAKDMLIAGTAGGWQTAVGAFRRFTWQGPAGHLHLRTNDNHPGNGGGNWNIQLRR